MYNMPRWKLLATVIVAAACLCLLWLIYAYFAFPGRVLVTAEDESGRRLDYFVAPEDAPIVDAVFAGNAARVEQLLESGANPNAVMEELGFGDTVEYWQRPIHWAAEKGNCRVLQALIKAGADANARDSCRVTPLINLAELRSAEVLSTCVDVLCRAGADPDALDSEGYGPLHLAVIGDNRKFAELLLDRGANVNALDGSACTPMIVACSRFPGPPCESMLELLARHGADLSARTEGGVDVSRHFEERRLFRGSQEG